MNRPAPTCIADAAMTATVYTLAALFFMPLRLLRALGVRL